MTVLPFLLAIGAPPQGGDQSPLPSLVLMVTIFAIFYFILILPQKNQRKKLEDTVKALKAGDKVILNPGIFATVVAVEDEALTVRIDEKTRMRVLKTAVAGLQGPPPDTEKK